MNDDVTETLDETDDSHGESTGDPRSEATSDGVQGRPKRVRFKPNSYEPTFGGKAYGATLMSVHAVSKPDCRRMYNTAVNVL